MKRIRYYAALLLAILLIPTIALASDISNALFFGNIVISNNGTATGNFSTNMTLNTDNLITDDFLNTSANNTVIRNASGADVIFMPGFAGNDWALWVPAIGANAFLSNILYTAESTGGLIRYFPGDGGMESLDSGDLELSDNFSVELSGFLSDVAGFLVRKQSAFTFSWDGSGNITAGIPTSINATLNMLPNAPGDFTNIDNEFPAASVHWSNVDDPPGAPDEDTTGVMTTNVAQQKDAYNLQNPTFLGTGHIINSVSVVFRHRQQLGAIMTQPFLRLAAVETAGTEVAGAAGYVTVTEALAKPGGGDWGIGDFNDLQAVIGIRQNGANNGRVTQVYVAVSYQYDTFVKEVSAAGVTPGEYTIRATANTTDLALYIDDVLEDSIALAGETVPNNSANWTYFTGIGGYWEFAKITQGGNLNQHIEWEYSDNFTDLTGSGNWAIPSFAIDSSDPDITASLQSFQPVSEAKAPDFTLADSIPFIGTGNMTGNFTTSPTIPGTGFPLAGVISAVAGATTPPQLPLMMIAVFVILTFSLGYSSVTRRFGSGSIFGKAFVIIAVMGVFAALKNFGIDFWMIVTFAILVTAIAMASRQQSWQ